MQKVVARFQEQRPGVVISVLVDKPLAQLAKVESASNAAGVALTLGEIEMNSLAVARAVRREEIRPFARNTYEIVAVAPASSAGPQPTELEELTSPKVKRLFIEDPARSSLGDCATRGLQQAGLWGAVGAKVVRPQPDAMVLAELLAGKADAAMVFKGCLFAEKGSGAAMPKTIRIVGELPSDSYPPITYQAAPLAKASNSALAREFVDFLTSPAGRKALTDAGLTPP
jgi:molybdate transport system substrate-binding protein